MKIAITGGTGFVGRKLVLHHLAQGHEVRVLSRHPPDEAGLPSSVNWFRGDLSSSMDLRPFVDGIDVLYHCAGEINDETRMRQVHIDGTLHLIGAATGRVMRWVQLSSVGAYGKQQEGVVTERTEPNPCGTYEITKVESDFLVTTAALRGAFEHVILRPSNVYGTEMKNQSLYGLIEMIWRGWFFFIGGPGASANYIHVDNVVAALVLCGEKREANGHVYNVSDHRSLEKFVAIITASLDKAMPRLRLPKWPIYLLSRLLGSFPRFPLSETRVAALTTKVIYGIDKIERELDYRHVVSMEAGLNELTKAWLLRNG